MEHTITDFSIRHKIISAFYDLNFKGSRKLAFLLPTLLIPKPTKPVVIKTLYGFNLHIDPVRDKGLETRLYYSGTYEKGTLDIISNILVRGNTFVDIGANIGLMSVLAAFLVGETGKVIAFEPNPETRDILEKNATLNSLDRIEIAPFAAGSKKGSATIYAADNNYRGSSSLIAPEQKTGKTYNIEVVRLDDFLVNRPDIHLMKLDIEGFELEALKGARNILARKFAPMLIVECSEGRANSFGDNISELFEYLTSCGYRLFKSLTGKERISKLIGIADARALPAHDNIYCFKDYHLEKIPKNIFGR